MAILAEIVPEPDGVTTPGLTIFEGEYRRVSDVQDANCRPNDYLPCQQHREQEWLRAYLEPVQNEVEDFDGSGGGEAIGHQFRKRRQV